VLSLRTVRRLTKEKAIPYIRLGRRVMFDVLDITKKLQAQETAKFPLDPKTAERIRRRMARKGQLRRRNR
jgi:hypothetical protein